MILKQTLMLSPVLSLDPMSASPLKAVFFSPLICRLIQISPPMHPLSEYFVCAMNAETNSDVTKVYLCFHTLQSVS